MAHKHGKLKLRHLLRSFVYLGISLVVAAVGTAIAWLLAQLFSLPYSLMSLACIPGFEWITIILVAAIYILLTLYKRKKISN
jgi:uncharacterized RDD family membrane protein YckC